MTNSLYATCSVLLALLVLPALGMGQSATDTSQVKKDSSIAKKKSVFAATMLSQNRLHYFGRTDSLNSGGLLAQAGYQLKWGLYVQGTAVFIDNSVQTMQYTGSLLEGGYRYKSKHFSGNVFFIQFLYRDNSILLQSAIKQQTGINFSYTNKIFNLTLGGDLKFSNRTDAGATAGLDHLFIFKGKHKNAFAFDPAFYAYAGTQNFVTSYTEEKRGLLGFPIGSTTVSQQVSNFNLLAYEVNMPIVYVYHHFNVSVTPAYIMPQNVLEGEKAGNLFYLTFGLGVRF